MNGIKLKLEYFYWLAFILVFVMLAVIQYYAPIHYHYAVPPGDDPYNHWSMIKPFLNHTETVWQVWRSGGYPPGFHLLIASISNVWQIDPIRAMVIVYPSIIIFASFSIWFLTNSIFGKSAALIALIAYGLTSQSPIQLLHDGGYPNLVATHVLLPLSLGCFFLFLKQKNLIKKIFLLFFAVAFALLVVFTHHISTFYLLAIILLSTPVIIVERWIVNKWKYYKGLGVIALYFASFAAFFYFYKNSELFAPARSLSGLMLEFKNTFPFIKTIGKADPAALVSKRGYFSLIGRLVAIGGILGVIASPLFIKRDVKKYFIPVAILLVWSFFLLIGSRLSFLTNPERMARDLAVPLSVFAGFFINEFFLKYRKNIFLSICAALFFIFLAYTGIKVRIDMLNSYQPMVRITSADMSAISIIASSGTGKTVITNSVNPWLQYFLQNDNILYKDSSNISVSDIKNANYLYLIDRQNGWSSGPIDYNLRDKFRENDLALLGEYSSPINEVSLYKLLKTSK